MCFFLSSRPQSKNDRQRKVKQILHSYKRVKKDLIHHDESDINYCWCAFKSSQRLSKKNGGTGEQRKNQQHTDHDIAKIG